MYFQNIESSSVANKQYNDNLKAAAARRLGDKPTHSQKMVSMKWNHDNAWANGAKQGSINRKQAARLARRVAQWNAGSQRQGGYIHQAHKPGSLQ